MVTLEFHTTKRSEIDTRLSVLHNQFNEIFICIDSGEHQGDFVCLDKDTAIKLAKELRKQISFMKEDDNE
jgi:hypothetical protein